MAIGINVVLEDDVVESGGGGDPIVVTPPTVYIKVYWRAGAMGGSDPTVDAAFMEAGLSNSVALPGPISVLFATLGNQYAYMAVPVAYSATMSVNGVPYAVTKVATISIDEFGVLTSYNVYRSANADTGSDTLVTIVLGDPNVNLANISSFTFDAPLSQEFVERGTNLSATNAAFHLTYQGVPALSPTFTTTYTGSTNTSDVTSLVMNLSDPYTEGTYTSNITRLGQDTGINPKMTITASMTTPSGSSTAYAYTTWTSKVFYRIGDANAVVDAAYVQAGIGVLRPPPLTTWSFYVIPNGSCVYIAFPYQYGSHTFTVDGVPWVATVKTISLNLTSANGGVVRPYVVYKLDAIAGSNYVEVAVASQSNTLPELPAAFTPASGAGLRAWYREAPVGNLTAWQDKSGNGFHTSISGYPGAAYAVATTETALGDKTKVEFSHVGGSKGPLVMGAKASLLSTTGFSIYLMIKTGTQDRNDNGLFANNSIMDDYAYNVYTNNFGIVQTAYNATPGARFGFIDYDNTNWSGTAPATVGTWTHMCLSWDGTKMYARSLGTTDAGVVKAGPNLSDGRVLQIGRYFNGFLAEVIIYNEYHSTTTQDQVFQYQVDYFGV